MLTRVRQSLGQKPAFLKGTSRQWLPSLHASVFSSVKWAWWEMLLLERNTVLAFEQQLLQPSKVTLADSMGGDSSGAVAQ